MRRIKRAMICAAVVIAVLWAGNTSLFVRPPDGDWPKLVAHRGVHQIYAGTTRTNETCTANPIAPITHPHIANTIPSMQAAFDHGADIVELDVHLTTDSVFAVFHDWTLECQTDGHGVTHEQSFDVLKTLDIGYGYSVDGLTFPLRGTGVGAMPTLKTVLSAQLGGQYLVNFKSNRSEEGHALAKMLRDTPLADQIAWVYGGEAPTRAALANTAKLRGFDKPSLKACLFRYFTIGWTGRVPAACKDSLVAIPIDYAPYLWGWPHRFTDRMQRNGSDVILWGPYDGTGFSSGIDSLPLLARVPKGFGGYIWTNRIEVIGPALHQTN